MAKAELNPMFTSLSGRVGGFVFYSYKDTTYVRTYVRPRNPGTTAQQKNRGLFGQAMRAWQGLSSFDKDSYRRRARRLGMTGHNLFISQYMTSRTGVQSPAAGPLHAHRTASHPLHHEGHSVCVPIVEHTVHNPAYGPAPHRRARPGPLHTRSIRPWSLNFKTNPPGVYKRHAQSAI